MNNIWSSVSEPWRLAIQQAWIAYRNGSFPVGAVIVNDAGKVLSEGRNALFDDADPKMLLMNHFMAHAEANAFAYLGCQHLSVYKSGYTLYTTLEPCAMCAGIVAISNVKRVYYLLPDIQRGASDLFQNISLIKDKNILAEGPYYDRIGNVMMAIVMEKTLSMGLTTISDEYAHRSMSSFLKGVYIGRELYVKGILKRYVSENVEIEVIFNEIACKIDND